MNQFEKRIEKLENEFRPEELPSITVVVNEGDSEGERALKKQVALVDYNVQHGTDLSADQVEFLTFEIVYAKPRVEECLEQRVEARIEASATVQKEAEPTKPPVPKKSTEEEPPELPEQRVSQTFSSWLDRFY
jgi:hypothetical protein